MPPNGAADAGIQRMPKRGIVEQQATGNLKKNNTGLAPPVRQHGKCPANALKHTSAKLRDKRDIVAAAATQSGAALQYASYRAKPIQTTETTGPRESIFTRLR